MMMLRKIVDCERLKILQENFHDGVSFSKVTSLKYSDCNFTIKRTQQRFFLGLYQKLAVLKRIKREKDFFL